MLRVLGAKATFFLVGRMAKAYPDAVRRAKSKMPSGHVSLGILARRTLEPRNPPSTFEHLFSLLARVVIRARLGK